MNFSEWEMQVPVDIRNDALWKMKVYRLALFIGDIGWCDVTKLSADRRMWGVSDQLYRSLGSISANLAEGYSRGTGRERAHFYEYAMGSARECRDWYHKSRQVLGDQVANHRIQLVTEIIRMLIEIVVDQRGYKIREIAEDYKTHPIKTSPDEDLTNLLEKIPFSVE